MFQEKKWFLKVHVHVIVLLFLTPIIVIPLTPSFAVYGKNREYSLDFVPLQARFYDLNSNRTCHQFTPNDFYPEVVHIGYNIHVWVWIYVDPPSTSDILVINLWNKSDPMVVISHRHWHSRGVEYYFHRPAPSDPEFRISLELVNIYGRAKGWISMNFDDIEGISKSNGSGVTRITYPVILSTIGGLLFFRLKKHIHM
ncbi:MAG: hypothetical protein ACFFCQ_01315 [Promethearchaeota archaeon]